VQTNQFVVVVVVVVALGLMGYITTSGSAVDLGGPFRSVALARLSGRVIRRRVPMYHVVYDLDSKWANHS
jgi:hypothetical protein